MRKNLLDLLSLNHSFAEHELQLKYKIVFLNSVFLTAALAAFGMGFYRWQHSRLMGCEAGQGNGIAHPMPAAGSIEREMRQAAG